MIQILQKLASVLLAFLTFFTSVGVKEWADSCEDLDYTVIEAEEKAENATRIMSFNIRCADVNGVPASKRRTIAVKEILEVDPDSFGVQEATPEWINILTLLLPQYGWVGVARDNGRHTFGDGEYTPIFYLKEKYSVVDSGNFWLSDTPDEPSFGPDAGCRRVCTWAILENRETGVRYVHINTHFDHISEAARVFGANIVNEFIVNNFEGLPVVFTADMNTWEYGEAYRIMTQNLIDTRFAADDSVSCGTFHDGHPEKSCTYLDYVLCTPDTEVKAYRTVTAGIDGRLVSDHFPIYADMVIG